MVIMAKSDITKKIEGLLSHKKPLDEDQVRSLMSLLRKGIELLPDADKQKFSVLNLFCDWCLHIKITRSRGLRTLAQVNDALVRISKSTDATYMRREITKAMGLDTLRSEMISLLNRMGIQSNLKEDGVWFGNLLDHLMEIISDTPITFPSTSKLKGKTLKIYKQISSNPIKPGAGVKKIYIRKIDFDKLGIPGGGRLWSILIKTEDTTTVVIPLMGTTDK